MNYHQYTHHSHHPTSHHHRRLLLRPPPLPALYPGGASAAPASPSLSSPLLIPFFAVFLSLLFFLLGLLFHDVFSFFCSRASPPSNGLNEKKNGVSESVLTSFPVVQYTDSLRTRFCLSDCAVCLADFEGGESVRVVTVCGHVFHVECVDFWLETHFTCPICRADLRGVCEGV